MPINLLISKKNFYRIKRFFFVRNKKLQSVNEEKIEFTDLFCEIYYPSKISLIVSFVSFEGLIRT